MKLGKISIMLAIISIVILGACGKKQTQQPLENNQPTEEQSYNYEPKEEPAEQQPSKTEETVKSNEKFPVPIYQNGEKLVSVTDLPEASEAAIRWAYDFFNTVGIQTEEEFYQLMKAKYRGEVKEVLDDISFQFTDYGKPMLPVFRPDRIVESFVVYPEVEIGFIIVVPTYIKLEGQERLHAIGISYDPDDKKVYGADQQFPMALD